MKTSSLFFLVVATLSFASPLLSQTETPDGEQPGLKGFWEVVTASGRFVSRLDHISSVSQHEYLIDGAVRVYECTVDTTGGQTARFYYLEPITDSSSITTGSATVNRIKDLANQASNKVGMGNVEALVTKHYPDTTHAKTTEFRLQNKVTVGQIYDHLRRVWAEERGNGEQNQLIIRNG